MDRERFATFFAEGSAMSTGIFTLFSFKHNSTPPICRLFLRGFRNLDSSSSKIFVLVPVSFSDVFSLSCLCDLLFEFSDDEAVRSFAMEELGGIAIGRFKSG